MQACGEVNSAGLAFSVGKYGRMKGRRMKKNKIDPREVERLVNEGKTSKQIGEIFGCSGDTIKTIVKENGIEWKRTDKTADILKLAREGKRPNEIAEITGRTAGYVYVRCYENGIRFPKIPKIQATEEELKAYIDQGMTNIEIAQIYGVSTTSIRDRLERFGIQRTEEQLAQCQQKGSDKEKLTDEEIRKKVESKNPDLVYLGGYINNKQPIRVRWTSCGHELSLSFQRINDPRSGCTCPICDEEKRREEREAREAEKERRRAEWLEREEKARQEKERREAEAEAAKWHPCPVCGENTNRPKYCSKECGNKARNKSKELKRRHKIADAMVDKDITVEGLYKRDGGRCFYCGKDCRLDDYIIRDGAFIAGDWYPSVDHVKPLAKGGKHSWRNVVLAHRICNTIKRDNEPEQMALW